MIPIRINTDELADEFNLSRKDVDDLKEEILSGLINGLYYYWQEAAKSSNLSPNTKKIYSRSINKFKDSKFTGGVGLIRGNTWLSNAIESGIPPFDIKIGELKSGKVKIGEMGQRYISIPFRIGTPGSDFNVTMPDVVYQVAKKLKEKQQIKTSQLPGNLQIPKTREFIKTQTKIYDSYTHKGPILAGIQKGQGKYHGQYNTFRTISSMSSDPNYPNAWIHKGIQAHNLAEKALGDMDVNEIVDSTINNFL